MTPLKLLIAGIDRTAWLANGYSIDVEKVLSTETFHLAILDLDSTAGAYRPTVGDDILLTRTDEGGDDIELLFGGEIADVTDEPIVDDAGTVTRIRCRDQMVLADQVFIPPQTYASAPAREVFTAIVDTYLVPKGVEVISAPTGGPTLPELRIDDFVTTVRQVLDRITLQCGWPWRINGEKKAGIIEPGELPGPATLSDDGASVLTDPPLRWSQQVLTHATRVFVTTSAPEAGPGPVEWTEVVTPSSGIAVVPVHVLPTEIRGATTADAAAAATSLDLDGLPADAAIRIGGRLTIETHTEVYELASGATTDADGAVTVSLSTGLAKDVPSGTSVTFLRNAFVQLELDGVVTPMAGTYVWEPIENAIAYPGGDFGGVEVTYRTWIMHPTVVREWDPSVQDVVGWFDYEHIIDQQITEEEGHTDLAAARTFAQAELAKRLTPPKRVTCTTRIPGHYPLLQVPLDFPDRLVTGNYLVAETRIRHSTIDETSDEQPLLYELVLWEGDSLGESWIQYFRGRNPSQGIRWGAVPEAAGMQWTTNMEYTAPAGAAAAIVTPNAVAWNYSAWVEVIASTAAASVLTAVHVVIATLGEFEIEVGVGAAAAEARIAAVKGAYGSAVNTGGVGECRLPIPIDAIPAASRVAVRLRKAGTSVVVWQIAIGYMEKPIVGDLQVSAQPTVVSGAGAAAIVVAANTTAWAWGAWTQLIASASGDLVLVAVSTGHVNADAEFEIGLGAAAAEVAVMSVRSWVSGSLDGPDYIWLPNPFTGITAGSRVSARMRKAGTGATGVGVSLIYMVAPL